jgi:hypothetical protein
MPALAQARVEKRNPKLLSDHLALVLPECKE